MKAKQKWNPRLWRQVVFDWDVNLNSNNIPQYTLHTLYRFIQNSQEHFTSGYIQPWESDTWSDTCSCCWYQYHDNVIKTWDLHTHIHWPPWFTIFVSQPIIITSISKLEGRSDRLDLLAIFFFTVFYVLRMSSWCWH